MRRKLVVGNWKMNGDNAMAATLCADIVEGLKRAKGDGAEIVLCPPHILIPAAVAVIERSGGRVTLGAQDVDDNDNGPFTGQVSARMIADSGCRHVIVGHSERRTLYGETDQLTARKCQAALAAGLTAIVCLGETREQRDAGATEEVVGRQLDAVLEAVTGLERIVIAYEPVWAIGTGLTATPAQAQQVHGFIRARLAARFTGEAGQCRILYGGSMKPENAADLLAEADIDGGLIGGASLKAADFLAICAAAA